jgi:hypothetical protein
MCIQLRWNGGLLMHGNLNDVESAATNVTPAVGSEKSNAPASGSDPDEWFPKAAPILLGDKDTGLLLHYALGRVYPLSSCYAYVQRNRPRAVPDHLVRKLIRSEQGEPWFRAYMDGCTAQWWLDVQDAIKIKRAIENR